MTELMVCVKCLAGGEIPTDGQRPGEKLYEKLLADGVPDGVTLTPVACLQNCDSGCSIALRGGPEKWTYVYGNLDASLSDVVVEGSAAYHYTNDGLIPWRSRSQHFKKNCIARIPPLEIPND